MIIMALLVGVGIIQAILVMVLMRKVKQLSAQIENVCEEVRLSQSLSDVGRSLTHFHAPIAMPGYVTRRYDS